MSPLKNIIEKVQPAISSVGSEFNPLVNPVIHPIILVTALAALFLQIPGKQIFGEETNFYLLSIQTFLLLTSSALFIYLCGRIIRLFIDNKTILGRIIQLCMAIGIFLFALFLFIFCVEFFTSHNDILIKCWYQYILILYYVIFYLPGSILLFFIASLSKKHNEDKIKWVEVINIRNKDDSPIFKNPKSVVLKNNDTISIEDSNGKVHLYSLINHDITYKKNNI